MHAHYDDIRSRISEEPQWFDSNGVPRYGAFAPDNCPNIYARQVALIEIACQACGERFRVEMHSDLMRQALKGEATLRKSIEDGFVHYGDPPIHGDGCSGNTMNCEDLRVLEFWDRGPLSDWRRISELEIALPDEIEADGR